jgi:hypothetical protein
MGAPASDHPGLTPLAENLSAEVFESRRIRRVACKMEYRERVRDQRIVRALTRRRLTDLSCVRH